MSDYPKMLYREVVRPKHRDGTADGRALVAHHDEDKRFADARQLTVNSAAEEKEAVKEGWSVDPNCKPGKKEKK